jgi:DNA-binding MarR family transcriptional regulator/GNAT superfamily N-acetyltransferase
MSNNPAESVQQFNRFYTRHIGALQQGPLDSPFSPTEARILNELAQREHPSASDLTRDLGLDPGYLSRILRSFQSKGLITRQKSDKDARRSQLTLTPKGRAAFAPLDDKSRDAVARMLEALPDESQTRLLNAMHTIEAVLSGNAPATPSVPAAIRTHKPGDIGWIIHRHGALYAREYGWNIDFEALVAGIGARFLRDFDPRRERCWIAERAGEIIGCVMLVRESKKEAKLRLMLVDPLARGHGLGTRLVSECIRFARHAGYKRITLWTQSILTSARHVYERAGFRLMKEEPHHSFGKDLVGEHWELKL